MIATTDHTTDDVLRVLLVEDDEDDATITRALLSDVPNTRFQLDWVSSYEHGLELMKAGQHDIDLLDYHLGSRCGLDLLREIREEGVQAPVILLTGQGNESIVLEAMRSGASDYLPKNLMSPESLERAISHAVEKAKLQKNLEEHHLLLLQVNAALLKRNEEIERFYHILAHELKTPLTAAREFVEILLEEIPGPLTEDQHEYLKIVDGCCDSLKQHINDMFDVTRLETGKFNVAPQANLLSSLIRNVVTSLVPIAEKKGVTLQYSIAPHLPKVFMDQHRIRQVLNNLLGNALKFTERGGVVKVNVDDEVMNEDRVRISVSDTGAGIAADQLDRIFDRLYQIRDDDSPSAAGLGLGLFISQEIVKLHGGTLSVQSSLGVGSTFSFTLLKFEDSTASINI